MFWNFRTIFEDIVPHNCVCCPIFASEMSFKRCIHPCIGTKQIPLAYLLDCNLATTNIFYVKINHIAWEIIWRLYYLQNYLVWNIFGGCLINIISQSHSVILTCTLVSPQEYSWLPLTAKREENEVSLQIQSLGLELLIEEKVLFSIAKSFKVVKIHLRRFLGPK